MVKISQIFLYLQVLLVVLTACRREDHEPSAGVRNIIHAEIEQDTKTVMNDENKVLWSEGDQVVAFMRTSAGEKYQLVPSYAGKTYADFEQASSSTESADWNSIGHNVVYYPYSEEVTVKEAAAGYELHVTLPDRQKYVHGSFGSGAFPMAAVSQTDDLTFRNICGGIKLQFAGSQNVASVKIEGKAGEKLSGAATVTAHEGSQPGITMSGNASTSVTLDCGNGVQLKEDAATEFIIALPPVSFSNGFTATVTDTDGKIYTAETEKANDILRSTLLVMPPCTLKSEEVPSESYYVKVAENRTDWSGDYLITYTSGSTVTVFDSFSSNDKGGSKTDLISKLTDEGIHSGHGDPYKAVVSKVGENYSVYLTGIGYLGMTASKNSVSKTDSAPTASAKDYLWTFSYKDGESVWMTNVGHDGYRLQWNKSASCFRCYNGSQNELTLYRRTTSTGEVGGGTTPTPDPTPDPDPEPDPEQPGGGNEDIPTPVPGQSGKYGWYELPVINYSQSGSYLIDNNDKDLYYAHHMCAGGEKGPGGKTARNYTVCFSAEHHCPVWVAAPRHSMYSGGSGRNDSYKADPSIPSDIQYRKKDADSGCNNGHMLGSNERTSSVATNKQVFYFSNIAPQRMDTFNTGGGGWNTLEDWVDGQVCSDTLYVVIGAYFDSFTDKRGHSDSPAQISFGGRSDVSRPTMFYYILMRTKSGSSGKALKDCTASEIKCAAFVRSHKTPKGVKVSEQDMMSVSDLEKITGFTYFPNVPQAPKDSYKAADWGL